MTPHRLTSGELDAFLAPLTAAARSLCVAARKTVLKTFPDAIETAGRKDLGYGFDRGYKGLVFVISPKKDGVNLGLFGGAALDDPGGLLRGTGKVHRHVEVLHPDALSGPAIADLLTRAIAVKRALRRP